MCAYPSSKYVLPYWKYVLSYCAYCPRIYLPSTESDQHKSNFTRTMRCNVYQHITCCTVRGRRPFNENKECQLCESSTDAIVTTNIYTGKELVVIESSIVGFHRDFYITAIHKLAFHLPHVYILGKHHCVNMRR